MLTLGPDHHAPDLLQACGGFAWWYVDAVDALGNGLVLIWSWGLPFLPGYGGAARAGAAPPASARPSLNVALYRNGRADWYLLEELHPDAAAHEGAGTVDERWTFGRTQIRSRLAGGRRTLEIALDAAVPGTADRLVGTVRIEGSAPSLPSLGAPPDFPHRWTPLCLPADATADLHGPGFDFVLRGRGYHDRNSSPRPLHALGIRDWAWGRVALPDAELVHYLLWSEDPTERPIQILFEARPDGSVVHWPDAVVERSEARRHPYGVVYDRRIAIRAPGRDPIELVAEAPVDAGPFYLRYGLRTADGAVRGWGERVRPAAVDVPWQRPFVRMRVHGPGPDSAWLPLFSGPREGRVGRLLRSWLP